MGYPSTSPSQPSILAGDARLVSHVDAVTTWVLDGGEASKHQLGLRTGALHGPPQE